jgi:ATP-dependent DNA helicase RecQ
VTAGARDQALLARLRERPPGPTIVYTTLQRTAARVADQLAAAGMAARAYHAGLETEERTAVQDWWMASDRAVVVATIAFGMGIDKADVRYVYHYNLPKSLESYSQEIGRAGRDGAPATVELLACPEDVPTLENFAYGDTPEPASLRGLVDELQAGPEDFHVSLFDLSSRHDIRLLVLRTALTYLELAGLLRQGTPFYTAYELRPQLAPEEIAARFEGERATFVSALFAAAKKGRSWYTIDPEAMGRALGQPRDRITRALDYFQQQGWAEVRASGVRQRYRRLRASDDPDQLVAELHRRFLRREQQEIARVTQVLDLVTHDGCQVKALVGYFGEQRSAPCGHCGHCLSGRAAELPPAAIPPPLPAGFDEEGLRVLRQEHPVILGSARRLARLLCGLGSPALTRARLTRHPLFAALEERRFSEVLAWAETLAA